jgi:hypothetical protein
MEHHEHKPIVSPVLVEPDPKKTAHRKKAYEKPAFLYRAPLEAMAAVCHGTTGKGPGLCSTLFS